MRVSVAHFRALLIDWDGTLIDSLPIKMANAARLFSDRFDLSRDDVVAAYRTHSGVPRKVLFDRISVDCQGRVLTGEEFEELSQAFTAGNTLRVAEDATLRKGALETLEALRNKGMLLFISTSATQQEIDILGQHFGLDRLCTRIIGSRPSFSKGQEHARYVMETFALDRSDLGGIGDDIQDMNLFQQAGIFAIGITGTRSRKELLDAGAALVVDELKEILHHVG